MMKKVFSFVIALVVLLSFSVCAFAANFINVQANAGKTELVSAVSDNGTDATEHVVLTQYEDRDKLEEEPRKILEEAYDMIDKAADLTELNVRLKNTTGGLIVSDLFDLDSDSDEVFPIKVTIKNNNLGGFIALLHYTEGEWEWVNIDLHGDKLVFTADDLSPFAIVVTGAGSRGTSGRHGGSHFVPSVSNSGAPRINSATQRNGKNVFGLFVITPYDRLETLPDDLQGQIKAAYASIRDAEDVSELNAELKAAAGEKTVAVSDLFDIRAVGKVEYSAKLVMDADDLGNFVGLLHYEGGEWNWVDTEIDGNELHFEVDSLSPFAIVVSVETQTSAQTGERAPVFFIAGALILAAASAWFFYKSRKVEG